MDFAIDWTKRIDFDLLRRERTKSLSEQIKKHKLDAILCFKAENLRYMTGYRPLWWPISFLTRNAGIMVADKEPILFPTSGCYERCRDTMYWMKKKNIRPLATMEDPGIVEEEIKKKFVPAFKELGITKGKIGIDHVSMLTLMKLKEAFPKADFVNGDHCVLDAQVIKNSEEIKCMRASSQMAAIAMDRAIRSIRLGIRECEILAEAMHALYSQRDGDPPVQPDRDLGRRHGAAEKVRLGQADQARTNWCSWTWAAASTDTSPTSRGRSSSESPTRSIRRSTGPSTR